MNKLELIHTAALRAGMDEKAMAAAWNALQEVIIETLVAGENVHVMGFGTFEVRERAARMAMNPRTKEKIQVDKTRAAVFKVGKTLKDRVTGK